MYFNKLIFGGRSFENLYTRLLVVFILILLLSPVIENWVGNTLVALILFYGMLVTLRVSTLIKSWYYFFVFLAILSILLTLVINCFHFSLSLLLLISTINIIFFSLAIFCISQHILQNKKVGKDTILGGVCIYFLIGLLWSQFYLITFIFEPNSFHYSVKNTQPLGMGNLNISQFLYFSYTTLTTLGYGDIVPKSNLTRVLSNLEAIIGQMYPAIFISRLVGLYADPE